MIFVTVSTGHFDALVSECNALSREFEFFGQVGTSTVRPVFPFVSTLAPNELRAKMAEAELVVSHAGTGMLSLLYQLQKPTVVIPKQIRYGESNDGQVELARKWAELGMGILCMDVKQLRSAIVACREQRFQFPRFPALGTALARELGSG